ncbi:membrane protein insertion efficiency factor YidD [Ruficoccus amylovorans]|uniref:Putative membrane protein insertion efficiency factor n=1 Tax=Ruficoccus amylovorans TaxID=1804625 RepID=A0A842HHL1_9BACT|nr:membrane protein insertion efficiency factor YidD [Ruficoccus amylovorans]
MPPFVNPSASLPARAAAALVVVYQLVFSPMKRMLLGPNAGCRFHPTCSEYARISLLRFGLWRGSWMALLRIFRCHPFHPGGHDPVPEKTGRSTLLMRSGAMKR